MKILCALIQRIMEMFVLPFFIAGIAISLFCVWFVDDSPNGKCTKSFLSSIKDWIDA